MGERVNEESKQQKPAGISRRQLGKEVLTMRNLAYQAVAWESPEVLFQEQPDIDEEREFGLDMSWFMYQERGELAALRNYVRARPVEPFPSSPQEHFAYLCESARALNGVIEPGSSIARLTTMQLSYLANHDPRVGHYTHQTVAEAGSESGFSTLLENSKKYRNSYASVIMEGFHALESQQAFDKEHPCAIILCGDGNGRILETVLNKIKGEGIDPALFKMLLIDASALSLEKQKQAAQRVDLPINITYQQLFANSMEEILKGNIRGILVAGEELVDDFLPQVMKQYRGSNLLGEKEFLLGEKFLNESSNQRNNFMYHSWAGAFPAYAEYAYDERGVPLNWQFLELINNIAKSSFEGYWIGGDYNTSFHRQKKLQTRALRAVTLDRKLEEIEMALLAPCNITMDVDPRILKYAQAKGMLPQFLGRALHFLDASANTALTTKDEIKEMLSYVPSRLGGLRRKGRSHLMLYRALLQEEINLLIRFNWVMAKGDVPPHPLQEKTKSGLW